MRSLLVVIIFLLILCEKSLAQDSLFNEKQVYFREQITFIEFVSLNATLDRYVRYRAEGDLFKKKRAIGHYGSIFQNDSTDMNRFYERKFIDDTVKNELRKIFFDNTEPKFMHEYLCYEPRNCILFYDKSKALLGIMEICFECKGVRYSTGFPMQLKLTYDQFSVLEELFFAVGITRGTQSN